VHAEAKRPIAVILGERSEGYRAHGAWVPGDHALACARVIMKPDAPVEEAAQEILGRHLRTRGRTSKACSDVPRTA